MVTPIRLRSTLVASLLVVVAPLWWPDPASAETTHRVEPGETLSGIADAYGLATVELAEANGISNYHFIRIGQVLVVPTAGPVEHVVQPGESVGVIAASHGVATADIVQLNGLADANRIRIGQVLLVPGGSTVAVPAESVADRYPNLPGSIRDNPDRVALVPSFERWAAHYGIAPDLVMAVAYHESGWQTDVVSSKGAIGVGQLLPGTADWLATEVIGVPTLDPAVPDDNIRMSTRFLQWLLVRLGDEERALAAYYQGPTSLLLRGPYEETLVYVATVEGGRWRFQPS